LAGIAGPLTVHGGAGANTLSIRDQANAMPGDVYYFDARAFGRTRFEPGGLPGLAFKDVYQIELFAGTGDNTIHVRSVPDAIALRVEAGDGGDTVHVGRHPTGNLDEITGTVFVSGGGGTDTLSIHDRANTAPADVYILDGRTFVRTRFEPINGRGLTFDGTIQFLQLYAGTGNNTIHVRSLPDGIPLAIDAGGGDDTVYLAPDIGGDLDAITGSVEISGAGGRNRLLLNDTLDPTGDTTTVTDSEVGAAPGDTLFRPGVSVTYHDIADLILKLGGGPDAVRVTPAVGTRVELHGGNPGLLTPPGDRLELITTGLAGLVLTPGVPGAGVYTFANRSPVEFFGFEGSHAGPPSVTAVSVGSSIWSPTFNQFLGGILPGYAIPAGLAQIDVLPWGNLNQISLAFSEDVTVDAADLRVGGVTVSTYMLDPGAFSYNAASRTATWRLASGQTFGIDRILIDLDGDDVRNSAGVFLDGDWINPGGAAAGGDAFPSGDGMPGGDFLFHLNVLPGDVNRDGSVSPTDFGSVRAAVGRTASDPGVAPRNYTIFRDVNGTGSVSPTDLGAVRGRIGTSLPVTVPLTLLPASRPNDPEDRITTLLT
jgi:hypothetical protein